jgi:predicted polyphosphate/ATP-dependent NAD kinase
MGFLVNPVAGMGGAVALKGTDDWREAQRRGGQPVAEGRAVRFLRALRDDAEIWTAGGAMGEDACAEAALSAAVVYTPTEPSTAHDTREAARALRDAGVEVLVFVGGDGTAADVAASVGHSVVVLGVPSGVKMYSAVFADNPDEAARVVCSFDDAGPAEVLDIDEDAFREGRLRVRLAGSLRVPRHRRMQSGKLAGEDDEIEQESLAQAAAEMVRENPGSWIFGAGSTLHAVKGALGFGGTLLGIDAARSAAGQVEALHLDAAEKDLANLPDPVHLLLSPIGAQGFILGRGNLQITPRVLRRVEPLNVHVVATPSKLLATPALHVDSGDPTFDARFPTYLRVLTGHHGTRLVPVLP